MRQEKRPLKLLFGAVDAAATVWLNGKQVGEKRFTSNSWQEPFEVDITDAVRRDRPNTMAVRVDFVKGSGGIWKPVWLVSGQRP